MQARRPANGQFSKRSRILMISDISEILISCHQNPAFLLRNVDFMFLKNNRAIGTRSLRAVTCTLRSRSTYSGQYVYTSFPHFPRDYGSKLCVHIERSSLSYQPRHVFQNDDSGSKLCAHIGRRRYIKTPDLRASMRAPVGS